MNMPSKKAPHKRMVVACSSCRLAKRKCIRSENDSGTCVKCHVDALECSLSRTTATKKAKRKNEEIEDTPERESTHTNGIVSTLSNPRDAVSAPSDKKHRNDNQSELKSIGATNSHNKQQGVICGICQQEDRRPGHDRLHNAWVECEIDNCKDWYHLSCILLEKKPRHMFFSLATGFRDNIFICHKCVGSQQGGHDQTALKASTDFRSKIERLKKDIASRKDNREESYLPEQSSTQTDIGTDVGLEDDGPTEFEFARGLQYQGYSTETVESLMRKLYDVIYHYDQEICSANRLFSDGSQVWMQQPLKAWSLIDAGHSFKEGQEWFRIKGTARNLSRSHTSITAALRRMLEIPDDRVLGIDSKLEALTFSQVHMGLIFWFVFDLLNDQLNMYDFPNMKPFKAMRAAVTNFGDARWRGSGRHVLREIHLRAWYIDEVKNEIVSNRGCQEELLRRMEDYLEPLTRKVGNISRWSPNRAAIMDYTIKLWSYLDAAGGHFEVIHPTIGGFFDPLLHILPFGEEEQLQSGSNGQMKILWIVHRGFRYTEIGLDGSPRVMVTKALVLA